MLPGSVAGMAGAGRGARLLSRAAVLVVVRAEPLALVFQKAGLSDDDLLPACPPLAHDGPPLSRFLTRPERSHGARNTTQRRLTKRDHPGPRWTPAGRLTGILTGVLMLATSMACWTWGARWYCALPSWFASITHRPGRPKVTVASEIEQAEPVEEASTPNVTGFPEPPPVAVTAYLTPR